MYMRSCMHTHVQMNGTEATVQVCAHADEGGLKRIPVLALTANFTDADLDLYRKSGKMAPRASPSHACMHDTCIHATFCCRRSRLPSAQEDRFGT